MNNHKKLGTVHLSGIRINVSEHAGPVNGVLTAWMSYRIFSPTGSESGTIGEDDFIKVSNAALHLMEKHDLSYKVAHLWAAVDFVNRRHVLGL